jgi:ATP-dependent RNA helicase SUPV3L1/SUV3
MAVATVLPAVGEAVTGEASPPAPEEPATEQNAVEVAAPADEAAQAPAAAAEPELVEVWRPGGRSSEERRSRRRPQQWQREHQPHGEAQQAKAQADGGGATEGGVAEESADVAARAVEAPSDRTDRKGNQHRRPRGQPGEFRRDREDGGGRRPREQHADRQGDRPERGRGERPGPGKGRGDHKDRRDFAPHREREKQADPNSPFAKLAALKAQLEAAAKERR